MQKGHLASKYSMLTPEGVETLLWELNKLQLYKLVPPRTITLVEHESRILHTAFKVSIHEQNSIIYSKHINSNRYYINTRTYIAKQGK